MNKIQNIEVMTMWTDSENKYKWRKVNENIKSWKHKNYPH